MTQNTRRQAALMALSRGLTVGSAAAQAQVSERSLYRWMREPDFAAELRQAQAEVMAAHERRLAGLLPRAAEVLGELLESESEHQRRMAAEAVHGLYARFADAASINERLASLEREMGL